MLDRRIRVPISFIKRYNLVKNGYKEEKTLFKYTKFYDEKPGGSTLNTVRLIAERTEVETIFVGAIGTDMEGDTLLNKIKNDKVEYHIERINGETAICQVFINENERSMVTTLGTANRLSLEFIQERLNLLVKAKFVYVCGFFVNSMPENAEWIFKNYTGKLIFNLSNGKILEEMDHNVLIKLFEKVDVFIGNYEEFTSLTKCLFNTINVEDTLVKYSGNKIFISTNGHKPTHYFCKNRRYTVEVDNLSVRIDTCGAGDFFAAGVLAGMCDLKEIDECVQVGHEWAKESIFINSKSLEEMINNIE